MAAACMEFSSTNSAKEYYISQAGEDGNPGTLDKPFKSFDKLNKLSLKAGDKVYLKGGENFIGTLSLNVSGSGDQPVIITSYGDGMASINGGNKESIIIRGNYFKLNNINAKGGGRKNGNTTNGIRLVESSNATVENLRTEGFQKAGLDIYNCKNIQVNKVYAAENGFSGIYVSGENRKKSKNILIKDCKAENNPGDPTNLDNHSGNGILVGNSDSVTIDHCTATNNGWDMPRVGNGPVGIWAYESDHIIIQYCISYRNKTAKGAKDGGGFDFDGGITNSVIQYCLSYENEGAGFGLFQYAGASLWYNNILRYSMSINDATTTEGSGGIFMWNNSDDSTQLADCIVHNNLIYSKNAPAVQFEQQSINKNFSFFNNIFIGSGEIVHGPRSGDKFFGNVWWSSGGAISFRGYKDLPTWADATGAEKMNGQVRGMQQDPLLKGPFTTQLTDPWQLGSLLNYTLLPGSPLINKGLALQTIPGISLAQHDFYGNPVPQGKNPELGVHEVKEK